MVDSELVTETLAQADCEAPAEAAIDAVRVAQELLLRLALPLLVVLNVLE